VYNFWINLFLLIFHSFIHSFYSSRINYDIMTNTNKTNPSP
jgi:hypothetical protein